ncbi:mitochondrial inner-membrane-bound regulator-domain-containing protein [Daldinia sp. FL1419]|nr:mitochondrial inner-membrane-bound regulator-domain-containing protein [Daldinia sp. FL1419]
MLTTRVTSGAICLRCRLRLLRQNVQPFQITNRITGAQYSSLQRFYSDSTTRSLDDDPEPHNEDAGVREKQQEKQQENEVRKKRYRSGIRFGSKPLSLHKKRFSRDRMLTEDSGGLNTNMLGKPASVIIMRDQGLHRKQRPSDLEDIEDQPDNRPANLEALLNLRHETPTIEEVRDNIESFRPKSDTSMPERTFRKLQAKLVNGFLSVQLRDYLENHKGGGLSPNSTDPVFYNIGKYSWVKELSPWVPLEPKPGHVPDTDIGLRGYVTELTPLKERIAIRIMRECWGLSIAELDASLGEISIQIRNDKFLLLMRGTRRWMAAMGDAWLDPGERIEASRNRKTIRLVAKKTKALTLIEGIAKILKQIVSMSFSSDMISSKLSEAVLEEVGNMTNTHVGPNYINYRVTWIESEVQAPKGPLSFRTRGEEVFRLLLTAFNPQPGTTTTLRLADLENQDTGRFITNTIGKENLRWNERMGSWARYVLPMTSEDSEPAKAKPLDKLELPVTSHRELPSSNELHESPWDEPLPPYDEIEWSKKLYVSTIAHFGSLLHASGPNPPPTPPKLLTSSHQRAFAAATPHAFQLVKFSNGVKAPVQTKTSVVMRFWPTPIYDEYRKRRGAKPFTPPAPLLELRLVVLGNEIKGIESFRAIKETHITDVMIPTSLVDVRFTQAEYAIPEGNLFEIPSWEPLHAFLKSSHLDLESGEFKTPPEQVFSVPWYPAMRSGSNDPNVSVPAPRSGTPQYLDTTYTLASLEVHRSISMPYEGFKLSYTSIQGGLEDGRKAEVTLEPYDVPGGKVVSKTFHDNFLAACQKLASTDMLWLGL